MYSILLLMPQESLDFSAALRTVGLSKEQRLHYCETIAHALNGFDTSFEEPVYELTVDQKKYLSVAVELVSNPSILFLDEPTTGAALTWTTWL